MDLHACGVKPETVSTITDLHPLLQRDGAVVLDGTPNAVSRPRVRWPTRFSPNTPYPFKAARVFEGGEFDHARTQVTNHIATPAHTDGFAYGDLYPDYMMLSCIRECAAGGETY